jgi:hypothetical protein
MDEKADAKTGTLNGLKGSQGACPMTVNFLYSDISPGYQHL